MVLVDTSVWIRYFSNHVPLADEIDRLLDLGEIAAHELIYGEILIGDRGGRRKFLAQYEQLHFAPTVVHQDALALVRMHKLYGRGVGWIDIHLLASALVEQMQFWTADAPLAAMAKQLGIAYR